MARLIKYILLLLIFCSCYSAKKANRQFSRAAVAYPKLPADYCSIHFPVKEITKSDTTIHFDTLYVGGDVLTDTLINNDTVRIARIITLPAQIITKTIKVTDTIKIENKAALASCEIDKSKLTDLLSKKTVESDSWSKKAKTRLYIMWGLIVLILGYTGYKVYNLFKPTMTI